MRLNKFIADAGVASRRRADFLIKQGLVEVNGVVVQEMGLQIDPQIDQVAVEGSLIAVQSQFEYLILHKPPGYLSTVTDPFGRPTVMELLPKLASRVYPVGRLDLDTSGLLFFTNDGELALALTHPRHLVEKIYRVKVTGIPQASELKRLSSGIILDDGPTAPAKVELETVEKGNAILRVTLREGRKRQVKRMMQAIDHPVLALHRLAMGPLSLEGLTQGKTRQPTAAEFEKLNQLKAELGRLKTSKKER